MRSKRRAPPASPLSSLELSSAGISDASGRRPLRGRCRGRHPSPGDPHAVRRRARQRVPDRRRPADARRRGAQLGHLARRARTRHCRARTQARGHRADHPHPPAHRPPGAGVSGCVALRGGGGRHRRGSALRGELLGRGPGRRRLRGRADAPPRHTRGRGGGAQVGLQRVQGLGRPGGGHPASARWGGARAARPHPARSPPSRPLPHGHDLPRPRAAPAHRSGSPAQPHLVQPADQPAARRLDRAPAGARSLPRLAGGHARGWTWTWCCRATATRSQSTAS